MWEPSLALIICLFTPKANICLPNNLVRQWWINTVLFRIQRFPYLAYSFVGTLWSSIGTHLKVVYLFHFSFAAVLGDSVLSLKTDRIFQYLIIPFNQKQQWEFFSADLNYLAQHLQNPTQTVSIKSQHPKTYMESSDPATLFSQLHSTHLTI